MPSEADGTTQGTLRLCPEQVRELLPQREPFVFVNGPADIVPGIRVATETTYAEGSAFYEGHFPGIPLTPGVIIIETMAQAASLMMLAMPQYAGQIAYLVGIREARFFKAVLPGAAVNLTGGITSIRHGVIESRMEAWMGGIRAASAVLTYTFRPRRSHSGLNGQVGG